MIGTGIPSVRTEFPQGRSLLVGIDSVDGGAKQNSIHLDGELLALQNASANVCNVTLLKLHCRTPEIKRPELKNSAPAPKLASTPSSGFENLLLDVVGLISVQPSHDFLPEVGV